MRRAARWTADRPLLGLAVLIGVLLPVTVAALSGNLAIPHNDGWAYSRIAETFGRTGRIELVGWNRSTLLGQVVPLGPLARSIVAQQLFIAVCSLVFLTSVHELLLPRLGAARAGVATVVVALWPGYALLSTSFMGDIPALALAGVTVLVGTRALERDSPWLFVVAMLIGLWGCTVRLQAIAAPAAVALAFLLASRRGAPRRVVRTRPVLVLGVAVGLTAVFASTWSGSPTCRTAIQPSSACGSTHWSRPPRRPPAGTSSSPWWARRPRSCSLVPGSGAGGARPRSSWSWASACGPCTGTAPGASSCRTTCPAVGRTPTRCRPVASCSRPTSGRSWPSCPSSRAHCSPRAGPSAPGPPSACRS